LGEGRNRHGTSDQFVQPLCAGRLGGEGTAAHELLNDCALLLETEVRELGFFGDIKQVGIGPWGVFRGGAKWPVTRLATVLSLPNMGEFMG
jgi:hypothetical protein